MANPLNTSQFVVTSGGPVSSGAPVTNGVDEAVTPPVPTNGSPGSRSSTPQDPASIKDFGELQKFLEEMRNQLNLFSQIAVQSGSSEDFNNVNGINITQILLEQNAVLEETIGKGLEKQADQLASQAKSIETAANQKIAEGNNERSQGGIKIATAATIESQGKVLKAQGEEDLKKAEEMPDSIVLGFDPFGNELSIPNPAKLFAVTLANNKVDEGDKKIEEANDLKEEGEKEKANGEKKVQEGTEELKKAHELQNQAAIKRIQAQEHIDRANDLRNQANNIIAPPRRPTRPGPPNNIIQIILIHLLELFQRLIEIVQKFFGLRPPPLRDGQNPDTPGGVVLNGSQGLKK